MLNSPCRRQTKAVPCGRRRARRKVCSSWRWGCGRVSRYECFVGGGLVRVWRLRRERTMDEQRKTAGIVLAVADERAGNASSHGDGCPGRGAYPRGPKTNAARRGGGPARKFFEFRMNGPGCRSPGVEPLSGVKASVNTRENLYSRVPYPFRARTRRWVLIHPLWGIKEARAFLARDVRTWRLLGKTHILRAQSALLKKTRRLSH